MEDEDFGDALIEAPPTPAGPPLALYRRYRPDTFAQVIGQEHVTEPLQRALVNNRVNHAYLFSGPRGCGKTTSARILARALNCERGPRAEPCGECQSCRDLATGAAGSIDVIEIDAASHGGVDDARDLRERAFFAPVSSRYKIYIVDEAHMVTTAGFNALLKLVEEPPPHVKFIFATTEPDKVIGTIRSRTHHYPFRLVPPRVLAGYLSDVCGQEGIAVENGVIPLVVRAGAGSVRDSLSVLDQLLGGASDEGVSYGHAAALLGYTPDSLLDEMMDAFAAGDSRGVFAGVDKVIEVGQDPRRFAEDLLRRLRDLVIVAAVPDALSSGLVDVAADQADRLSSQAAALGPGELTRAAEVIAAGLTEMRGTTAPRLHLELMCARVLLPGSDVDERGIHARLDRLERRIGMGSEQAAAPSAPATGRAPQPPTGSASSHDAAPTTVEPPQTRSAPTRTPAPDATSETEPPAPPVGSASVGIDPGRGSGEPMSAPDAGPRPTTPAPTGSLASEAARDRPAPDQPAPTQPASSGGRPEAPPGEAGAGSRGAQIAEQLPSPGLGVTDVRRLWPEVLEEVKGRRRFTWILLSQNAQIAEMRDGVLVLAMPNAGARENFARGGSEDVLREALVVVLGADLRIETMVDPSAGGTRPERSSGDRPGGRSGPGVPSGGAPAPARSDPRPERNGPTAPTSAGGDDDWPEPVRPPGADSAPTDAAPDESAAPTDESAGRTATRSARSEDAHGLAGERPGPPSTVAEGEQPSAPAPPPNVGRRPTRTAGDRSRPRDDADEGADRDDAEIDDLGESGAELLVRHLGAEIIAEEEVPR